MDDLTKSSYTFVLGACMEWNLQVQLFKDMTSREFLDFVARTHTVVYRCLKGQQYLDGTCSDLECTLTLRARSALKM